MHPVSGIARPLDVSYLTNRAIAIFSLAIVVIITTTTAFNGVGIVESMISGAASGLVVFLAWALGREVDPDHDLSALFAAALMAAALFSVLPLPDLVTPLWLLLLLRLVNRTTGRAATPIDVAVMLILTLWHLWQGFLMAGPIAAAALLIDGTLRGPAPHRIPAAGIALAAAAGALFAERETAITIPPLTAGIVTAVVATVLFLLVIAESSTIRTSGDSGGRPLDAGRVRAAQALALATALITLLWKSGALVPLWAAVLAAGTWQVMLMIRKTR
ncbi:heme O synthase-like polyprenyltransferase [Methanofollis sp. W23]|uniref:hypothetical protein n=1 Tax=Methanofollis sp. W23 TaxID=2817849 RepID=UPI001AE80308|nr:hypothetical protein [Methanofollis sp. W23]MBP2147153.1 heme O synthase-like polyprenyltransferase [Methanofollis sp. W23]